MTLRGWLFIAAELALSAVLVFVLLGQVSAEKKRADDAERLVDQQSGLIATQSFQFNRFNHIAAAAGGYAVTIQAKSQEKEIEYRTILKTEPTCVLLVPSAIAGRLLEYANSLRASAMHSDSGGTDEASTYATTASTLTYCQAVLWIDPLLTTIAQANSQLAGIRDIEDSRLHP